MSGLSWPEQGWSGTLGECHHHHFYYQPDPVSWETHPGSKDKVGSQSGLRTCLTWSPTICPDKAQGKVVFQGNKVKQVLILDPIVPPQASLLPSLGNHHPRGQVRAEGTVWGVEGCSTWNHKSIQPGPAQQDSS